MSNLLTPLHVVDVDAHESVQLWVPTSIFAKKGDTVTLILENHLMEEHGYEIEAFGVKEVIGNHKSKTVTFKATKAGVFPIKCQLHKPENHYAGQIGSPRVAEEARSIARHTGLEGIPQSLKAGSYCAGIPA